MNEIEKLYVNVGIEPTVRNKAVARGYYIEHLREEVYPPFTAEKELKLIKWFIHSRHFCPIRFYVPWLVDDIAEKINFLWEKMTEEEKQQIKEILE